MKQSNRILKDEWEKVTDIPFNDMTLSHLNYVSIAQRKTAIEFTKWVEENYSKWSDGFYFPKIVGGKNKTLDQIYEEWDNINKQIN